MKSLAIIFATLFTATAFADIQMICNTKGGYTTAQFNAGIPSTIMTTLITANSGENFSKSTLSIEVNEMRPVSGVQYDTPDENMITATYKAEEKGNPTEYQILFYVGGGKSADLYKIDADGEQIEGTTTEYSCGMYDDGQY